MSLLLLKRLSLTFQGLAQGVLDGLKHALGVTFVLKIAQTEARIWP